MITRKFNACRTGKGQVTLWWTNIPLRGSRNTPSCFVPLKPGLALSWWATRLEDCNFSFVFLHHTYVTNICTIYLNQKYGLMNKLQNKSIWTVEAGGNGPYSLFLFSYIFCYPFTSILLLLLRISSTLTSLTQHWVRFKKYDCTH